MHAQMISKKKILRSDTVSKIKALKQNLADTDYQAIKYAEGVMSAEEYEPIKQQRQAWRDEINTLEQGVL